MEQLIPRPSRPLAPASLPVSTRIIVGRSHLDVQGLNVAFPLHICIGICNFIFPLFYIVLRIPIFLRNGNGIIIHRLHPNPPRPNPPISMPSPADMRIVPIPLLALALIPAQFIIFLVIFGFRCWRWHGQSRHRRLRRSLRRSHRIRHSHIFIISISSAPTAAATASASIHKLHTVIEPKDCGSVHQGCRFGPQCGASCCREDWDGDSNSSREDGGEPHCRSCSAGRCVRNNSMGVCMR